MRIVVAVDWSDEAFAAVQAVGQLYSPEELALVHAVDVTPFESPVFAPHIAKQAYQDVRESLIQAGHQLLEQTADLAPAGVKSVRRLCELGSPSDVVVETARAASADLLVLGTRSRGRVAELMLGSVSHRVLLHAPCSTLIVKRPLSGVSRVLVAVEGPGDAGQIRDWLTAHPFIKPVELTLLHVLPNPHFGDPATDLSYASWVEEAEKSARRMVTDLQRALPEASYSAGADVISGFPAQAIAEAAERYDLVIVGSHGRTGISRFLLGSVSHTVVHRVSCPILVLRK